MDSNLLHQQQERDSADQSSSPPHKRTWFFPNNLHLTFLHTAELFPNETIPNNPKSVRPLEYADSAHMLDPDTITFNNNSTTLSALLKRPDTDALMVLHHGKIVYQRVNNDMTPTTNHWTLSLCRTIPAIVAGLLVEQGKLDMHAPVESVIPELASTGFAGVTLRQLLDMRSGVTSTFILRIMWADGFFGTLFPSCCGLCKPRGIKYHLLQRKKRENPHGGAFKYRCLDTEVIGWLCERASGKRFSELVSELLWKPMGAEQPASFLLDVAGDATYEHGLCASLCDLALFGRVLAEDGTNDQTSKILPQGWMQDTRTGDEDTKKAFPGKFFMFDMPNGMYRNHMWVLDVDKGITLCYGAFGQMVYVDPCNEMVCVLLSSWKVPVDGVFEQWMKAFESVGERLSSGGGG